MTLEEFAANCPLQFQEAINQGRASVGLDPVTVGEARRLVEKASKAGATGKRETGGIAALALAYFGPSIEPVLQMAKAGVTAEQYKAIRGVSPRSTTQSEEERVLKSLQASDREDGRSGGDFWSLVVQYQRNHSMSRHEAIKAVVREHPAAHKAMLRDANPKAPDHALGEGGE